MAFKRFRESFFINIPEEMPCSGDINALSLPEVLEAAKVELGEDRKQMEVNFIRKKFKFSL